MKNNPAVRFLVIPLLLVLLGCSLVTAPQTAQETPVPATATPPPASLSADAIEALVDAAVNERLAQLERTPVAYTAPTVIETDLEATLTALYARANPAVVYIIVSSGGVANSSGSGFVYTHGGYIVTNSHVVSDGSTFEIVFYNGDRAMAKLIGADPDSDLAVLKVDSLPEGIEPLPVTQTDTLQVGQFVVAIGNPFGEQGSMTLGIVSGLGRSLQSQRSLMGSSTYSLPEVVQTDAPINPGNSGGPLLNLNGEVVGVNAAIASVTGTSSGVGFSIPAAAVRRVVPSLISDGRYVYPYMGVSFDGEITLAEQELYGLPQIQGAYVVAVTAGGPGDKAGIIAADPNTGRGGDLIIALDDQPINSFDDLNSFLSFHASPGQTIAVKVLRGNETVTLSLTLGARP
ncbi:MAG: putative periplasmic serine endoprotease DegP-like precursor [Chloroflexi bacterium ADurb.Bin222]|nr:MAG: putative periplasmic serine endoprotease DegP-like precursor [Chloroflexi bacterium ADurb.Bin222]